MIRFTLFMLAAGLCGTSFSKSILMPGAVMDYQVISDTYDTGVPQGMFGLRGQVISMYGAQPVAGALVANYGESVSVRTDSSGFFQLYFPMTDTAVYCFKDDFHEIIFKGPFTNRHLIEIKFFMRDPDYIEICAKPVIYAYNAGAEVRLSLKPQGGFSFTYPEHAEGWNFKTNADGTLTDVNTGKNYPYLFWEGPGKELDFVVNSEHAMDFMEGYLIKTDTCVAFLENILAQIGLNDREMTDFITFWAPQITKKEYALVQFLDNAAYSEMIAEMVASPEPVALLRVYMFFMPLDSPELNYQLAAPFFKPFERTGFTLVEWGGTQLHDSIMAN